MGNHVIYDGLWKSRKLARCSTRARAWYPWIFLVCDEWGRFEYRAYLIWSTVFAPQLDYAKDGTPTVEDVSGFLSEYDREGLLIRYHLDGDLAVWTNFKGRPPAKRRKSPLPDHRQFPEYKERLAEIEEADRKATGRPLEGRWKADRRPTEATSKRLEQEQETRAIAPAVADASKSWSSEAVDDWRQYLGDTTSVAGRIGKAIKPLVDTHGWDVVRPLWIAALEEAVLRDDLSTYTPEQFGRSFVARLNRARGLTPRSPPARQTVGEKTLSAAERFIQRGGELDRPEGVREGPQQIGDGLPSAVGRRDS